MKIKARYTPQKQELREKKNRMLSMPADTACLVRGEHKIHKTRDIKNSEDSTPLLSLHRIKPVHGYFFSQISTNLLRTGLFSDQQLQKESSQISSCDTKNMKLMYIL